MGQANCILSLKRINFTPHRHWRDSMPLSSIQTYRPYEPTDPDWSCSICLGPYDAELQNVLAHPGEGEKHAAHESCLIPWIKSNTTCPSCRVELDTTAWRPLSTRIARCAPIILLVGVGLTVTGLHFLSSSYCHPLQEPGLTCQRINQAASYFTYQTAGIPIGIATTCWVANQVAKSFLRRRG